MEGPYVVDALGHARYEAIVFRQRFAGFYSLMLDDRQECRASAWFYDAAHRGHDRFNRWVLVQGAPDVEDLFAGLVIRAGGRGERRAGVAAQHDVAKTGHEELFGHLDTVFFSIVDDISG
ncbi:hypothetical protein SDC9_211510 [bioreactor metagenome]|uniref:Uncharacterized protein n=1 Tax=bioreactor metagenome TaxID=1076179 RepID=A0A645JVM0_9ZZZZ